MYLRMLYCICRYYLRNYMETKHCRTCCIIYNYLTCYLNHRTKAEQLFIRHHYSQDQHNFGYRPSLLSVTAWIYNSGNISRFVSTTLDTVNYWNNIIINHRKLRIFLILLLSLKLKCSNDWRERPLLVWFRNYLRKSKRINVTRWISMRF